MSFGADWKCSCGWANLDVRIKCRNCGTPNPEPNPVYVARAAKLDAAKPASPPRIRAALEVRSDG